MASTHPALASTLPVAEFWGRSQREGLLPRTLTIPHLGDQRNFQKLSDPTLELNLTQEVSGLEEGQAKEGQRQSVLWHQGLFVSRREQGGLSPGRWGGDSLQPTLAQGPSSGLETLAPL